MNIPYPNQIPNTDILLTLYRIVIAPTRKSQGKYKSKTHQTPSIRGEFIALNGGADFYASNIKDLHKEGKLSLKIFLEMCREEGIHPHKEYSGKFNLRVPPEHHAEVAAKAALNSATIGLGKQGRSAVGLLNRIPEFRGHLYRFLPPDDRERRIGCRGWLSQIFTKSSLKRSICVFRGQYI